MVILIMIIIIINNDIYIYVYSSSPDTYNKDFNNIPRDIPTLSDIPSEEGNRSPLDHWRS
jgi:hypothetical protein